MKVDTGRSRATPEGVTLTLRVAGPPVRFCAWAIDAVTVAFAQGLISIPLSFLGEAGVGLYLLSFFALSWFYPVAFEVWRRGATPGKAACGLQVLHDDGTPVGPAASLLRNLLRFADFLPFAFGAGLTAMLLGRDFQRLGDLAAGTLVVYRDEGEPERRVEAAPPVPPPIALGREEARAIVDYAGRVPSWTPERAAELAGVLRPLTGAGGEAGVRRLVGMANWILGRKAAA